MVKFLLRPCIETSFDDSHVCHLSEPPLDVPSVPRDSPSDTDSHEIDDSDGGESLVSNYRIPMRKIYGELALHPRN